jgi:hypothetical protein
MQTYNPNNPVYKYKSDKPIVPTETHNKEQPIDETHIDESKSSTRST